MYTRGEAAIEALREAIQVGLLGRCERRHATAHARVRSRAVRVGRGRDENPAVRLLTAVVHASPGLVADGRAIGGSHSLHGDHEQEHRRRVIVHMRAQERLAPVRKAHLRETRADSEVENSGTDRQPANRAAKLSGRHHSEGPKHNLADHERPTDRRGGGGVMVPPGKNRRCRCCQQHWWHLPRH